MLNKILIKIKNRQKTIINSLPVVLFSYFILILSPTIFSNFDFNTIFNNSLFLMIFKFLIFSGFILYSFMLLVVTKQKINKNLVLVLIFLFILAIVSMILLKSPTDVMVFYVRNGIVTNEYGTIFVYTSLSSKLNSLFSTFSGLFLIYIMIDVFPKAFSGRKDLILELFKYFQVLSIAFISYSILFEADILWFSIKSFPDGNLSSLFAQKNSFARILLFTVFTNYYLLLNDKSKFNLISFGITNCYLLLIGSITSDLALVVFYLFYFSVFLIKYRKKHTKAFVISIIVVTLISLIIILALTPLHKSLYLLNKINGFLKSIFNDSRPIIWKLSSSSLGTVKGLLIGYGEKTLRPFVFAATSFTVYSFHNVSSLHNGLITVLFSGGVLYFIAYFILLSDIFLKISNIKKSNFKMWLILISIAVSFFVYQTFESTVIGSSSSDSFIITFLLLTLPRMPQIDFSNETL